MCHKNPYLAILLRLKKQCSCAQNTALKNGASLDIFLDDKRSPFVNLTNKTSHCQGAYATESSSTFHLLHLSPQRATTLPSILIFTTSQ